MNNDDVLIIDDYIDLGNKEGHDFKGKSEIDSTDIDASIKDLYHHHLQKNQQFFLDSSDSEGESSKKLEDWWDPRQEDKIVASTVAVEKEKNSASNYQHHIIIQLEDTPIIKGVVTSLISKHLNNTALIQFDIKNKKSRHVYGNINSNLPGNVRWTIIGNGHYFSDDRMTTFSNNTPQELVNSLVTLKSEINIQKKPDKIALVGCNLSKGSASNNFALEAAKNFYQLGFDMPIVAYNELVYVDKNGHKLIALTPTASEFYPTNDFKQTYQFDKKTRMTLINGLPAIIHLMRNYSDISNQFGYFVIQNQAYLQPYFTREDSTLDYDLIKKSIFSFAGSEVFVKTITSFVDDDFSSFHQMLTAEMKRKGVLDIPIWKHISYPTIERWAASRQSVSKEQLNIIIRLSDKEYIRDKVFYLAAENIKNTVIIQLDINADEMHIEYGDLTELSKIRDQKWTIIDTINNVNSNESLYLDVISKNVQLLCEDYHLNQESPIELLNVIDPATTQNSSNKETAQSSMPPIVPNKTPPPSTSTAPRDTIIRHGPDVLRRQISNSDPIIDDILQQYTRVVKPIVIETSSKSTQSLNNWWGTEKIVAYLPSRLGESSRQTVNYKHNIIIQLEGDDIINESAANIFRERYENSTLIQFNTKTKECRIVYGNVNIDLPESIRWIVIGNGHYVGDNKMTLFADNLPHELVGNLLYLKSKLNIQRTPNKIELIGSQLSKGSATENFSLQVIKYFHQNNIDIPIIAYSKPIKVNPHGKILININPQEESHFVYNRHKDIYQIDKSTKLPLINGFPAILHLMFNYPNISYNLDKFIEKNIEYLKFYFTHENGLLDIDLIKKSICSLEGVTVFVDLVASFKGADHASFHQILADKMILNGIVEVPIWDHIDYSMISNRSDEIPTTSQESVHIILRLNNEGYIRNKVSKLAEQNIKNTIVIQLDLNSNKSYIEYGSLNDLSTSVNQHWTVVDGINHSSISPKHYFNKLSDNIRALTEDYTLKKVNQIDVFHLSDPLTNIQNTRSDASASQQLSSYHAGDGYFPIALNETSHIINSDYTLNNSALSIASGIEQSINEDYQEYLSKMKIDPMELHHLPRKLLAEWQKITDRFELSKMRGASISVPDETYNIIIQLEDDPKARIAIRRLISKHPDNTIVIQYNIANNEYRVAYGNIENTLNRKTRWISIGNGYYFPWGKSPSSILGKAKTCLTTYAGYTPEQFSTGLISLQQALKINKNPDKLVLIGCDLAKGNLNDNFAFNTARLLGQKNITMPLVAYTSIISIDDKGNKIFTTNNEFPYKRAKDYRQEYKFNADSQLLTINGKPLVLDIINQYQFINQSFTQFIADNTPYLATFFSQENGELDQNLIKKVALDQRSYQIFHEEIINSDTEQFDSFKFYKNLVIKIAENNNGFDKGPMWQKVDHQYINNLALVADADSTKNEGYNIIIRFSDSESNREQSAYIAAKNPKNTVIIQFDIKTKKSYIEYGDIASLQAITNQNWTLIVPIRWTELGSPVYAEMLANSQVYLQQIYELKIPKKIKIIDLEKNSSAVNDNKYKRFLNLLSLKLSSKNINSIISLQSKLIRKTRPLESFHFGNNFTYNIESKLADVYGEHYVKHILSEFILNDIKINKNVIYNYPFILEYFTNDNGEFDFDKLQLATKDPLISRKVNAYFVDNKFLHPDRAEIWQSIFLPPPKQSIKQKALDLIYLLDELQENPQKIRTLGQYSMQLLNELSPSMSNTVVPDILNLINQPEKIEFIQQQLNSLLSLDLSDSFDHLSLRDMLLKQSVKNENFLNSYGDILNISRSSDISIDLSPMIHSYPLLYNDVSDKKVSRLLGRIYIFYQQDNSPIFTQQELSRILNYIVALNHKSTKMQLSIEEKKYLSRYQLISSYLMEQQESGILQQNDKILTNQSLTKWLVQLDPGNYQIETKTGILTFVIKNGPESYQYSLLDSNGWAITYSNSNKNMAQKAFLKDIIAYLNSPVSDIDSPILTRAEHYGMRTHLGDYLVDIHVLSDSYHLQTYLRKQLPKLSIPSNDTSGMLHLGKMSIPIKTLNRLGANIDGVPLNKANLSESGAVKRIRFDAEKLLARLTHVDGNKSDINLIQILKLIFQQHDNPSAIITSKSDIAVYSVLSKQLNYINNAIDGDNSKIKFSVWNKLQTAGVQLPRYAKAMNVAGQGMMLLGTVILLTSTYSMLEQLDNPLLSDADRKEIHKNLGIAWTAGFFNLTDIAQPWLLNLAYKQTKSFNVATSSMGKLSMGLNAIGAGIDLGASADIYIQLLKEKDPERRQDLMVNFYLSLTSAGVGLFSLIGIGAGLAVAGPAGLLAGGVLMLAGLAYNGVRVVNQMKKSIKFDSLGDEIEEGLRAAFGLSPTIKTQNKLREYYIREAINTTNWHNDLHFYSSTILPLGFDSHLFVEEYWDTEERDFYRLQITEKYKPPELKAIENNINLNNIEAIIKGVGYLSEKNSLTTKDKAALFTAEEVRFLNKSGWYQAIKAEDKNYVPLKNHSSDEKFIFDNNYQDDLLENYFSIPKNRTNKLPLQSIGSKGLRLYTLNSIGVDNRKNNKGTHKELSPSSFIDTDDRELMEQYLPKRQDISGLSINTGIGDDIVIGSPDEHYNFKVYNGNKLFVGGDKNDSFFYMADDKSVAKNGHFFDGQLKFAPTIKYFDARGGSDTLFMNSAVEKYRTKISLKDREVSYLSQDNSFSAAFIHNFENIVGHPQNGEILEGDDDDNYLDGGGGKDKIYGWGGNDRIMLSQGYANGGIGDDYYTIKRYIWSKQTKNLYINQFEFCQEKGKFVNKQVLNKKYSFKRGYGVNSRVEIDECSSTISNVELEYTFREISDVKLVGNDLHIYIDILPHALDKNTSSDTYLTKSKTYLILKNVYRDTQDYNNKMIQHKYNIKTQDGFLLTSALENRSNQDESPESIFNIQYIKEFDKNIHNMENLKINIDTNTQSMNIDFVKHGEYRKPSWGTFIWRGINGHLVFSGDDNDNILHSINNKNIIYASHGIDYYHFVNMQNNELYDITFDFTQLADENGKIDDNNNFTDQDKMILIFEHHLADDLTMQDNTLYFKNKESNKVSIKFINFEGTIANTIYIKDKNNKLFSVELNQYGGSIDHAIQTLNSTDGDDNIFIPPNYPQELLVIESKGGDDIIVNLSGQGRLIKGDEGNDILTANIGENVFYGGQGDDQAYGGMENDLFIANLGNDKLLGRGGDDFYLIDGTIIGNVIVEDSEGHNNIYLMDYSMDYEEIKRENNSIDRLYRANNGNILTIRNINKEDKNIIRVHDISTTKNKLAEHFKIEQSLVIDRLIQHIGSEKSNHMQGISSSRDNPQSIWSPIAYFTSLVGIPVILR